MSMFIIKSKPQKFQGDTAPVTLLKRVLNNTSTNYKKHKKQNNLYKAHLDAAFYHNHASTFK